MQHHHFASETRSLRVAPTDKHTQSGWAFPWILVTLVLAIGGGVWWWQTHPGTSATGTSGRVGAGGSSRFGGTNAVQPVSVQPVRLRDIRVTVNAIGSIAASNTATVHTQVSGVLQRLEFKEGQQVKVGQLLAQIDPRAFQATLAQAEGALARDQAQLDGARLDLARYRNLLTKDAIAKQQIDSQFTLVGQLEGTVKADQAAVDSARLQLSYTRVTAPIAGRVGLKQADLGNIVQPADVNGVVIITQTRPIALVFSVPSVNVPLIMTKLRKGQSIPVQALDRGGKTQLAVGQVATLDNAIDPSTDTIKVKALFANADDALFPNQAVGVSLQLDTLSGVLAVPQAAVLRGSQGFYVYVVNADNSVGTRAIKPGAVDGNWMAVEGALQVDEKVVIDGTDRLREGAKVEVIAADPTQRVGANATGAGKRGAREAASSASAAHGSAIVPPTTPVSTPSTQAASEADRPRWMEGLSPEQINKVKIMSPEERRAWVRQQRRITNDPATR